VSWIAADLEFDSVRTCRPPPHHPQAAPRNPLVSETCFGFGVELSSSLAGTRFGVTPGRNLMHFARDSQLWNRNRTEEPAGAASIQGNNRVRTSQNPVSK